MADSSFVREGNDYRKRLVAAAAAGKIHQHGDGRATVMEGLNAAAANDDRAFTDEGIFTVPKTANMTFLEGQELWWDRSAGAAVYLPGSDRDFYLGTCVGGASYASTECSVNLNKKPTYYARLGEPGHEFLSTTIKTVVGSTTVEVPHVEQLGSTSRFILGATAEAQKVDLLSKRRWAPGAKWIAEFIIDVIDDGDATAIDFSIGVANDTHDSDADSITESCFFHLDGNTLDLFAESDDGTTEVAATDTTVNIALGTPIHLMIDGSNLADLQLYVNGANVLPNSVFKLDLAAGPLGLLAHLEKSADDTTADYRIVEMKVRLAEQAA